MRRVKGNNARSNHSNSGLCLKISLEFSFHFLLSFAYRPLLLPFFLPSLSSAEGHTLQNVHNYNAHELKNNFLLRRVFLLHFTRDTFAMNKTCPVTLSYFEISFPTSSTLDRISQIPGVRITSLKLLPSKGKTKKHRRALR